MVSDDKIIKIFCEIYDFIKENNQVVELEKKVIQPLNIFLKMFSLGKCTSISFIDSTTLKVCHYKREKQHKIFKEFRYNGLVLWF